MEGKKSGRGIRLSIILVVYNMQRAAPRVIMSLLPPYQLEIDEQEYEILVIENGSTEPLDQSKVESTGRNVRYFYLKDPPKSPAYAINYGVENCRGEILAIMIDGAHIVTPKLVHYGILPYCFEHNPIVTAPRFFLGHEPQGDAVLNGYSEKIEDGLLEDIEWPKDGYRLYEIGVPYRYDFPNGPPKLFWFVRQFESNCLFVRKRSFENIGGCDERFDLPGGGCLMPDLYRELCEMNGASIVQILGEASFHQVHGGVSTSATRHGQKSLWDTYTHQYEQIRGRPFDICRKPQQFVGHMPHRLAAKLMLTG